MNNFWPTLLVLVLFTGLNASVWGSVGVMRFLLTRWQQRSHRAWDNVLPQVGDTVLSRNDVAVLMAAYNEALVIADSIRSLLQIVRPEQVFIVSDGSTDQTAAIARGLGVHVWEIENAGKARALQEGIAHFQLARRYAGVLFVDADTVIDVHYIDRALPYLADPRVAAVAGFARTLWQPAQTPFWNMLYIAHRERVYLVLQYVLKYAQAWFGVSVTPIIPGFCSIYKAQVLSQIDIAAPGLVIEDYNMTFEVHKHRLGSVILDPGITAYTQDPHTFTEYYRQVRRWHLGFWQTVRRHGFWPSGFSLALLVYVTEVLVSAVTLLCLPVLCVAALVVWISGDASSTAQSWAVYWGMVVLLVWAFDYGLSLVCAIVFRRPQFAWYGVFFILLRYVDAWTFVSSFPRAFFERSSGRWRSPTRRALGVAEQGVP